MSEHEAGETAQSAGGAEVRLRSDYCIFERGGTRFALSTRVAREVLDPRSFTPVPRGPAAMLGAFNLRGEVIPLLQLDRLLGLPDRPIERSDTWLVLGQGDATLAAVVDGVATIKHIAPWEIQRHEPREHERNPLVRGAVGKDAERTLVLDGERLIAAVAAQIAAGFPRRPGQPAAAARSQAPPAGDPVADADER